MSKILIEKLSGFKHYKFDDNNRNITNLNKTDANINEFFEIIHLLDSKFVNYTLSNNFDISILGKR